MSHIIDDFMFFGPANSAICQNYLDLFIQVSEYLGIPIKHTKTFNASTCLNLHGIKVCTSSMTASLPPEKLVKAFALVNNMLSLEKTTFGKLQELCGFLNFCLKIIPSGRAFMRRLYDLTKGSKPKWFKIKLNGDVKQDLVVWKNFLEKFNGKTIISKDVWCNNFKFHVFSDASGFAYAAFLNERWFQGNFPDSWKNVCIAIKEFIPVYLAMKIWFMEVDNTRILFHVDNISVVYILNNQTSNVRTIMFMLRDLVLVAMDRNIQFEATHISGAKNLTADFLSRLQIKEARKHSPQLQHQPDKIPQEKKLLKELFMIWSKEH